MHESPDKEPAATEHTARKRYMRVIKQYFDRWLEKIRKFAVDLDLQLVLARTDPNLKKLSPPWICFFSSF